MSNQTIQQDAGQHQEGEPAPREAERRVPVRDRRPARDPGNPSITSNIYIYICIERPCNTILHESYVT